MAKTDDKPSRPKGDRVQGIDSVVNDLVLRGTDRKVADHLALEVGLAITGNPKLTRTIYGASSLEVEVYDPQRRLLRHSLVESKWDVEIDGLHFRYPGGLTKSGDTLTLTFEDRWMALLREKKGPKRVVRGSGPKQMTRAEFIKMLVEEACGKGLRFYCPQLHVVQPIDTKAKAKKAKKEAKENRGKGIGDVKGLKVKGQTPTPGQTELIEEALQIADSKPCPDVCKVAVVAALIDETDAGAVAGNNVLEALEPYTKIRPAAEEISGFLFGTPTWTGVTAVGYQKAHPHATFFEIAQAVQKSGAGEGSNGAANYGQFGDEARAWVEAYGGGELSESIQVKEPFEFKVAKKEDYWHAIKELAKDVNWRAFIVGDTFFYVPEPELLQGMVRLAIDGSTPGVEKVDFEYDHNNPVTEIEIEALVSQWKPPPGSVITLADHGPASIGFGDPRIEKDGKGRIGLSDNRNAHTGEGTARYLLSSIEVPLADDPAQRMAQIKAHKPTAPLPEPANATKSAGGSSGSVGSGEYVTPVSKTEWAHSRTDMGVDFAYTAAGAKIFAIGNAKILPVPAGEAHWEGGNAVLYELTDGPRAGTIIYNYEGLIPKVSPGSAVNAGDVIATGGITGSIELGFANSAGEPLAAGEYAVDGTETKHGKQFRAFMDSLGAP